MCHLSCNKSCPPPGESCHCRSAGDSSHKRNSSHETCSSMRSPPPVNTDTTSRTLYTYYSTTHRVTLTYDLWTHSNDGGIAAATVRSEVGLIVAFTKQLSLLLHESHINQRTTAVGVATDKVIGTPRLVQRHNKRTTTRTRT